MPVASIKTFATWAPLTAVEARRHMPPVVLESRRPAMMSFNTPSLGPSERRSTPVCGDEAMSVSKIRQRYHYAGSGCPVNLGPNGDLARRAHHHAQDRGQHERNNECNKRRMIAAGHVVNKTEERRAGGAECVGDEDAQAAHRAEREAAEVSRPNQLLQHKASAQADPVKKKADIDRQQLTAPNRERQAQRLDQKHHRARIADLNPLADKTPD